MFEFALVPPGLNSYVYKHKEAYALLNFVEKQYLHSWKMYL